MKMTIFASLILITLAFAGCQSAATQEETKTETKTETKMETTQTQKEIAQVSVAEAKQAIEDKKDTQFIDVRTPKEYAGGHATGAKNLPLDKLDAELTKLNKNKPVYVICETGRRSQKGSEILQKAGFKDVYNITGGTSEWMNAKLPTEK
jgi:rhodanese-related sulfurtransferase